MNFFLKGDFKIGQSWEGKPSGRLNSREKSRDKNRSLVNAGKNIIADPKDILDDDVTKHILKQFAAEIPPPPSTAKSEKKISPKDENSVKLPPRQKSNVPQSENQLITSMAARLKAVQATLKNQRQEIRDKSTALDNLKAENAFLKGMREDPSKEYDKMKKIEQQNEQLKKKVGEMQNYLKKYGLKWVGDKMQGQLDQENIRKAIAKGNYQYRLPKQIDINTIARRIQELNAGLYSQGKGTEVYSQNGIHKFRKAEPLSIGFFANGIAISGYKFFSYQSKESLQVLGDLVDGYFPYVLKGKYPNGVFLKVVDKIAERYTDEVTQGGIVSLDTKAEREFQPPSKEEFLSKLPKSIMKNGKVIKIRQQIEKRLNGESDRIAQEAQDQENDDFQKSEGVIILKTKPNQRVKKGQTTQDSICTLKVRSELGEVIILQLQRQSKISEVYKWLRKVVKGAFKVMSNFPRRSYEQNEAQNLDELGFFPNAMLHLQGQAK